MQGPREHDASELHTTGLLRVQFVLPWLHYSPYGRCALLAETSFSCVPRLRQPFAMQTLHGKLDEINSQLSATMEPLSSQVEQTSQFVQQTVATVGQVLERASATQAQTQELCKEVVGILR